MRRSLVAAVDKPSGFIDAFDRLVAEQTLASATDLFARVKTYRDWGVTDLDAYTWFLTDVEMAWLTGTPSLEDL